MHPITGRCKIIVDIIIGLFPVAFRTNLLHERRASQVRREIRGVRIRVLRENVVNVVVAGEGAQDIVVAVRLGARTRGRGTGVVT